jgi:hypothetical protein
LNNVRTFITSRLLCGLREGNEYSIEFYYRSSDSAFDSLGIYLSSTDFLYENRPFRNINPTIWVTKNEVDKADRWTKRTCVFTATGKENYFTIGTFKRDDLIFNSANALEKDIYLYLDKISLVPTNANERICESADSIMRDFYKQNDRHSKLIRRRISFLNHPPLNLT